MPKSMPSMDEVGPLWVAAAYAYLLMQTKPAYLTTVVRGKRKVTNEDEALVISRMQYLKYLWVDNNHLVAVDYIAYSLV